jgi:TIR domain
MEIALFADNTVGVSLQRLAQALTSKVAGICVRASSVRFRPKSHTMDYGEEYEALVELAAREKDTNVSIFLTSLPFENNFFYTGLNNVFLVSLSGWHSLTDLPMANGIAYLVTSILLKYVLSVGENHDVSTGCINDFMWDKSIVDAGMRAAFVCERCRSATDARVLTSKVFRHLVSVLDIISVQSRRGQDMLEGIASAPPSIPGTAFDIFLCHNSSDKPAARLLNARLKATGIKTWFDEEALLPGQVWQDVLERQIGSIAACAVIVGPNGEGPWQENERRTFINEFVRRSCLIVPVLIAGASTAPALPLFLQQFMWCDLRGNDENQFDRLVQSIRMHSHPPA